MNDKKYCKYCNTTDNLYQDNKKRIYSICNDCRPKMLKDKASKAKETLINKFGVTNPSQLEDIKKKKKETTLKNFGVEYPMQSSKVLNKLKKNNLKKYGHENVSQIPSIKKIKEETSLTKFGTKCTLQSPNVHKKTQSTLLEKYNVDHPLKSKEILSKQEMTNIDRYGSKRPAQNKNVLEKMIKTNLDKRSVPYVTMDKEIIKKMNLSFRNNNWENYNIRLSQKKIEPLFGKDYYINSKSNFKFKCLLCGNLFESDETNPQRIRCNCTHYRSTYEEDILEWLKSLNIHNIYPNKRFYENGKYIYEIDLFLEDYNIGIDFDGLYWHSDLNKENNYHQDKWKFFNNENIELIQVFENEWLYKNDIVKSIILNKLNLVKNSIYARKCEIKEVSKKDSDIFLLENHLQGYCSSKIKIGLYYNKELVSIATFGKSRFDRSESKELLRYANKLYTSVIGGFSKLIKYYLNTYNETIISYVDLRYFSARAYLQLGFNSIGLTKPNYYYFKLPNLELLNRILFQKHKLKNKLDDFDPNLSEVNNMLKNGYNRIFDAGNLKLILTNDDN